MTRKKSNDEIFWENKHKMEVREMYNEFLKKELPSKKKESSGLDSASIFFIKYRDHSLIRNKYSERELILELEGKLPAFYD